MKRLVNEGMTECFAYSVHPKRCRALNRTMDECNASCAFFKTVDAKRRQEDDCAARLALKGRKYGMAAYKEWRLMMDGEEIDDGTEDW